MVKRMLTSALVIACIGALQFTETQAQNQPKAKTVRGYYCGQAAGNRAGAFGFRVGNQVKIFMINFGQIRDNTKMVGFNINDLEIGQEFRIQYKDIGGDPPFPDLIKATGRKKQVAPCSVG
jgi:hypothetical protein